MSANLKQTGRIHPLYRAPRVHLYRKQDLIKACTPDEVRDKKQLALRVAEVRLQQARQNPNAFIEYCFENDDGTPFQQAWFHEDWQAFITQNPRALIIAPRSSGKTSQIVGRALWELGRNHNLRIKIVCASDSKAVERLFEIVQHIDYNPRVREVFPDLRQADFGEFTKHKIVIQRTARHRDASIEALGIGSTATGGRADLIIADDVVDRRNALAFPALRKMIKDAWFSDWTQLLVPNGRVIYICTLWHKADLSHALLSNTEYKTLKYDVGANLEPIWPEVWSTERLMQRKREIGQVEFDRSFRNIAQDVSEGIVRPEWVRYYDPNGMVLDDMFFVLSYDIACGKRKRDSDSFFTCVAFAVHKSSGHIYVHDAYQKRISIPEQEKQIILDWQAIGAEVVLVEAVGGFEGVPQHLNVEAPGMNVVRIKPTVDKVMRMNRASLYLEKGMVSFNRELDPKVLRNPEHGDLVSQLFDFPIGSHDDLCDAFSQGVVYIARKFLDQPKTEAGEVNVYIIDGSRGKVTGDEAPNPRLHGEEHDILKSY